MDTIEIFIVLLYGQQELDVKRVSTSKQSIYITDCLQSENNKEKSSRSI